MTASQAVATASASATGSASPASGPKGTPAVRDTTHTAMTPAARATAASTARRPGRRAKSAAVASCSQPTTAKNMPCAQVRSKCSPAEARWITPAAADASASSRHSHRPVVPSSVVMSSPPKRSLPETNGTPASPPAPGVHDGAWTMPAGCWPSWVHDLQRRCTSRRRPWNVKRAFRWPTTGRASRRACQSRRRPAGAAGAAGEADGRRGGRSGTTVTTSHNTVAAATAVVLSATVPVPSTAPRRASVAWRRG